MKAQPGYEQSFRYLMRNITRFVQHASGITLRSYQAEPALAIIQSIVKNQGHSFVIIFPRQSGKNELQAQIQTYLLTVFSKQNAEMVSISPTWKPQTFNAMRRLENVLSKNLITFDRWSKSRDYIYRIGNARCYFLSGSPTTNIVGATANNLLSIDEAQDILIDKFDKEIAPMAASTNATRIFWGTAWTSNTLLAREEKAALAKEKEDGVQRVWRLTADDVAAEVPPYGLFVADQVSKLGRNHPMVRTQYFSEDIDAAGGLFPPERLALIYGIHPPQHKPEPDQIYVMTLDVAGEDETGFDPRSVSGAGMDGQTLTFSGRDATALTIARVNLATLEDPAILMPTYEIVFRKLWVGIKHTEIYSQVLSLATTWAIRHLVCDATGVGAGLASFLSRSLGSVVIPFSFNSKTKSILGWDFLSLVDTGRLKTCASPERLYTADSPPEGGAKGGFFADLDQLFFKQLEHCQYEIIPGPDKKLKWGVPDTTRDLASGELLHDDLAIGAALLTVLDGQSWAVSGPAALVPAADPLDDMAVF